MIDIRLVPLLQDNYAYLLKDGATGKTAVVDPTEAKGVSHALDQYAWDLDFILNTHHHWDHTGGNEELKQRYGAQVVGFSGDRDRIPGIDIEVNESTDFMLGESRAKILEIPGHTTGHIAFWFADSEALFCGDTLFSLGCGRLFEGTPEMMWSSLKKIKELPPETKIYCGHEYTQANAAFAKSIEPDNQDLLEYSVVVDQRRSENFPTVPSTLELELKANPFLRADVLDPEDPTTQFAKFRRKKDSF